MSVSTRGTEGNKWSGSPSSSADGRYVAFGSIADNLVLGDRNRWGDVFVSDTQTRTIHRVSVDSNGREANGYSNSPKLSRDGKVVSFWSRATNLVSRATKGVHVFVRDLNRKTTELVSVSSSGQEANADSGHHGLSLSPDGRYVAFVSRAANLLVPNLPAPEYHIYLHDRGSRTTRIVSATASGVPGNGPSYSCSVSAGGQFVAFASHASNLASGDTNNFEDVFIRDMRTGKVLQITHGNKGSGGHGTDYDVSLAPDGRHIAFSSEASNIVLGDTNGAEDVFVAEIGPELQLGTIVRASVASNGAEGNGASFSPSISAAADRVVFGSIASNLVSDDTNSYVDCFLRDIKSRTTIRLSIDSAGCQGDQHSVLPVVSASGNRACFESAAANLVQLDTNGTRDIFIRDFTPVLEGPSSSRVGQPLVLHLYSPGDAGRSYLAASALGYRLGIPTDVRTIPLNPDPLLFLSLRVPSIWSRFFGTLDANGRATATILVPNSPALSGFAFYNACITIDGKAPSAVSGISNASRVTLR